MDNPWSIVLAVLFGAIGMGYLIYGKKQQNWIALLSGVALCAFPYFISNLFLMIIIGVVFIALPFVMRN